MLNALYSSHTDLESSQKLFELLCFYASCFMLHVVNAYALMAMRDLKSQINLISNIND